MHTYKFDMTIEGDTVQEDREGWGDAMRALTNLCTWFRITGSSTAYPEVEAHVADACDTAFRAWLVRGGWDPEEVEEI